MVARTPATSSRKPVTPRKPRMPRNAAGALSASEALKAAEAAIAPPPARPVVAKAPRKPAAPVVKAAPAPEPTPVPDAVAIMAATTAVDAGPELPMPDAIEAKSPVTEAVTAEPKTLPEVTITKAPLAPATLIEGTTTMNDVMETGKKFAEDAKAKLETVYAGLNDKAKVSVEKSTKAIEEMNDMAKGNVEAIVEAGKIAAKAIETMSQEAVEYSRKNFEKATASMKTMATAKTPTEFFQLQSAFLSSSFDEFTKEAAKSSEAMMKLAGEVAQPLTARVAIVTDKVKSLAA